VAVRAEAGDLALGVTLDPVAALDPVVRAKGAEVVVFQGAVFPAEVGRAASDPEEEARLEVVVVILFGCRLRPLCFHWFRCLSHPLADVVDLGVAVKPVAVEGKPVAVEGKPVARAEVRGPVLVEVEGTVAVKVARAKEVVSAEAVLGAQDEEITAQGWGAVTAAVAATAPDAATMAPAITAPAVVTAPAVETAVVTAVVVAMVAAVAEDLAVADLAVEAAPRVEAFPEVEVPEVEVNRKSCHGLPLLSMA